MLTVAGAIIDADGVAEGYVRLDPSGRVVERGRKGAPIPPSDQTVEGIVLPRAVNGHTHLGDAVWTREPPHGTLEELVAPPSGLKHRVLAQASPEAKIASMRSQLKRMHAWGTGLTLDFREEGVPGVQMLRTAESVEGSPAWALGRPSDYRDAREIQRLLGIAEGLGLSALKDLQPSVAESLARETRRRGKFLALHVSEGVREPIDPVLDLHPSLLIHGTTASPDDLERISEAKVAIAFCPRSNALYGRWPPIAAAVRLGLPVLLGTDNAMFNAPNLFREMEFAYLTSRQRGEPLAPEALVRAVFITPWEVIGRPEMARLTPGGPAPALVLRLPTEDPYYSVSVRGGAASVLLPSRGPG